MDKVVKTLKVCFFAPIVIALILVVLYETEVMIPGFNGFNTQAWFIILTVMELLTIAVIPAALYLFKVKKVKMERRASLIQYEVKMTGGDKLQFSKDGTLTECECTKGAVPSVLIPARIKDFMAQEFPDREIRRFEHDSKLYELLLDNGDELSFNSSYRLIDIDRAVEQK